MILYKKETEKIELVARPAAAAGAPKAGAAAVVPNAEGAAGVLPKAEVPAAAGGK